MSRSRWDEDPLERLDRRLRDLVPGPITPGAVVLLCTGGTVVFEGAYGWAQTHDEDGPLPQPRAMTLATVVDVASITKLFTTAAFMRLHAEGEVTLDTPASVFLPALDPNPALTVDALLTHRGGLAAWQPVYLYAEGRMDALEWVCRHGLRQAPGHARRYSDLGFMLLGGIVEQVTGERLDRFCKREIFGPTGMTSTCYAPPPAARTRIAATSTGNRTEQRMIETDDPEPVQGTSGDYPHWRSHTLVGDVQDGNAAYALEAVAGSAGAFSTASDLAAFGLALSDTLSGDGSIWSRSTLETFLEEPHDRGQARGWWTGRCDCGGKKIGVGHAGFTGCEIAVVPQAHAVAVLLTNRLHTERDPPIDHTDLWNEVLLAFRRSIRPSST